MTWDLATDWFKAWLREAVIFVTIGITVIVPIVVIIIIIVFIVIIVRVVIILNHNHKNIDLS